MHIDHININAPYDLLTKVKDFYCAVFGFVVGEKPPSKRRGFWLYHGDKALIHLSEIEQNLETDTGYFNHVAFQTKGLDSVTNKLSALGIQYSVNASRERGITQVFFKDPAGIGVEAQFQSVES